MSLSAELVARLVSIVGERRVLVRPGEKNKMIELSFQPKAPPPVVKPVPVAPPVEVPATPTPVAAAPAPMQIVDLHHLLSSSGLELVDTDASKLARARVEPSQAPSVGRAIRERKRMPPPGEPLAQVETRKH